MPVLYNTNNVYVGATQTGPMVQRQQQVWPYGAVDLIRVDTLCKGVDGPGSLAQHLLNGPALTRALAGVAVGPALTIGI